MSLDIALAKGAPSSATEISVSFDDDENGGYYWFLHPLFERLAHSTGQYIDVYGFAEFRGDDLAALDGMLSEARQLVLAQPEQWSVHVGTQGGKLGLATRTVQRRRAIEIPRVARWAIGLGDASTVNGSSDRLPWRLDGQITSRWRGPVPAVKRSVDSASVWARPRPLNVGVLRETTNPP